MPKPYVIAITGGPCAGKTTVLEALQRSFSEKVLLMPEVATMLLGNGFPVPGVNVPFSDEWLRSFQLVVYPLQTQMEVQYLAMAERKGISVLIIDRGLIDGAAYYPEGKDAYFQLFNTSAEEAYARYDEVWHLETVAVCNPGLYEKLRATNQTRYETIEQAQALDGRLRDVWQGHAKWRVIPGADGIDPVVNTTVDLVGLRVQTNQSL